MCQILRVPPPVPVVIMFVYVLRFGDIVKVGHTSNLRRAQGKVGYAEEARYFGDPISLVLETSRSRLEDEAKMLFAARRILGPPYRGREWFAGSDAQIDELVATILRRKTPFPAPGNTPFPWRPSVPRR